MKNRLQQEFPRTTARRSPTDASGREAPGPERRRRRVLDAAAFLFANQGFEKTRVEEIARRARVSKGLVYVHFESKEALLERVLADAILDWADELERIASASDDRVATRIEEWIRSWIEYAERHPIFRRLLAQDPDRLLPTELNHTDHLEAWYTDAMTGLLRRGVARGEVPSDLDVASTATSIWILFGGLHRELFVAGRDRSRREARRLTDATIRLILGGVVRPARSGRKKVPQDGGRKT